MRKIIICFLGCFLLFFCFVPADAGDTSDYIFYGFSDDLRYCAFETYGVQGGNGFPYSIFYIVDVDKNKYAVKPMALYDEKNHNLQQTRELNAYNASANLNKYRINPVNMGRMIFTNPKDKYLQVFKIGEEIYALRLLEKDADILQTEDVKEKILELQLIKNQKVIVLQKDKSLPRSRGYAYRYRLVSAYINKNKIAVFVEYERKGFEGPEVRQIVITGVIDR